MSCEEGFVGGLWVGDGVGLTVSGSSGCCGRKRVGCLVGNEEVEEIFDGREVGSKDVR